jgi:hypothetical protein
MTESLLNKEFQEKDIQRARNLITGNYGGSTQTIVGYTKQDTEHKEGDVWEEGGKTWTIEDGVRISVSKLQKARDLAMVPLTCPKCGKPLTMRWDKKMYKIHHICGDCVAKFEDDLKRAGLYKAYEREMMKGNIEGFVSELKARVEELGKAPSIAVATDNGEIENWGSVSQEVLKSLDEWSDLLIEKANSL